MKGKLAIRAIRGRDLGAGSVRRDRTSSERPRGRTRAVDGRVASNAKRLRRKRFFGIVAGRRRTVEVAAVYSTT